VNWGDGQYNVTDAERQVHDGPPTLPRFERRLGGHSAGARQAVRDTAHAPPHVSPGSVLRVAIM
jgi:hypothetical protein